MAGTLGREVISTRQRKIAALARREPKLTLTTLAHHIDEVWMRAAYRRIRKDAAAGVDGVTAAQYEADLEANLTGLLERFKSGRYRAPAVRRVHLEKPGTSKTRPIGIPTLEDKILQRAVLMVLEPVYEQDFVDCSYGFRPGRGAHQALQALWDGLMKLGGGWVIDLDIEDFFASVDWGHLRSFLDRRVRDGVIRRAIGKWLNAGVMEAGELSYPQRGTPQGGVVSPTLSNVYLHEVLDQWFEHEVKPRLRGRAFEVRYADDAVLVFEHEDDARRVLAVLAKRLEKYGLRLHPDKTRMVEFCSPSKSKRGGSQRERSFAMLGFTHYWGRSRKGRWVVKVASGSAVSAEPMHGSEDRSEQGFRETANRSVQDDDSRRRAGSVPVVAARCGHGRDGRQSDESMAYSACESGARCCNKGARATAAAAGGKGLDTKGNRLGRAGVVARASEKGLSARASHPEVGEQLRSAFAGHGRAAVGVRVRTWARCLA